MARDLYPSITLGVSISLLHKYNGFKLMIILSADSPASDLWSITEKRRRHLRGTVATYNQHWMGHNDARAEAARIKHGAKEDVRSTTCASAEGHLVSNGR